MEDKDLVKLKTERTNLRRLFTTSSNQFDVLNADPNVDGKQLQVLYSKIVDKAERLFAVDAKISALEEISEQDFDTTETYRDRFTELKSIYELYIISKEVDNLNISKSFIATSNDNMKLPKLNLKEYDLNPRTWVAFWGQFSRINEDKQLREEDKFQYLLSSLKPKSKARDIVESYPPFKDNYAKTIEHLKSRFGRDDLLIEVYIRDLLALVTSRGSIKLAVLYDKLGSYLRALETLGVTTANYASMLYPVVESCLPVDVLKAWDRHRLNRDTDSDSSASSVKEKLLEELMVFLGNEVEGEEHRALAESGFESNVKTRKDIVPQSREPSAAALISHMPSRSPEKVNCIFCDRPHNSQDCGKAATMTVIDRKAKIFQKRCCLVCLKIGHMAKTCRSAVRCLICGRRHYALLCPELPLKNSELSSETSGKREEKSSTLSAMQSSSNAVYLKTLMLRVRNLGRQRLVRALLDDGSHRSYVTKDLAKELNLSPSGREILSHGLFGGKQTPEAEHARYEVTVESLEGKNACKISVLDQSQICTTLPRVRDPSLIHELALRNIRLTDVGEKTPPIKMLLGSDVIGNILTGRIEVFRSGISAIETKLGWSILGTDKKRTALNMVTLSLQNFQIPKFWELETLGITDPIERKSKKVLEEETLTHFKETIKKNEDKRYEVSLPWIAGHPSLNDNYDVASARLRSVTKRLKTEKVFDSYDNIFHEWEKEGIIESVSETGAKLVHYLPHRPVIKLSSATTKIRPVFDASVKRQGCASLNDCLSVGPSLSQQIFPLLNRFRLGAIGITADIKQAFLQLSVRPEDREVLRFLWWVDKDCTTVKEYKHCRVVFGVTSSPFLLNATISHHLNSTRFQEEGTLETVKRLKEGFYVDNFITSVNTESEYEELKEQACKIMSEGQFDLRCWAYTGMDAREPENVLGLRWNTQTDELYCVAPKINLNPEESVTKRKLLSIVNSIYDPIGFTSVALLLPKLLLQEAWRNNLNWDDALSEELQKKFRNWAEHIHLIEQITIPRRMFRGQPNAASMHVFTDASAHAYACCAFLRCEDESGVSVQLISAKTRIAPMQRPTIPRLELLGAAIGARLSSNIIQALGIPLKTFYWTDSMVVLAWITKMEPWNTFVGNRVKEIRELTDANDWRHVPGEFNPADVPSRSSNWSELLQKEWWEGPKWLKEPDTFWPNSNIVCPQEALLEKRKTVISSVNLQPKEEVSSRFLYFSQYSKILRMTAWMLRFRRNTTENTSGITSSLNGEEVKRAEIALVKMIQGEWPSESREKYGRSMQFYEEDGLLKVKTKLILGDDHEDFQRPTVLPDHPIVRRLIEHTHKILHHAGVQTTLAYLRERFWIPRGRRIVREVLRNCVICKRHSSKPVIPETAPLPIDRIQRQVAFHVTGADLAGPIYLRGGVKAWIVLFTCAVYRAIHLEMVTSLSTEAFMQAMRRFFARRGRSSVLYTDNGTNFVGTSRALQGLDWDEIQRESALLQIKWKFNPPSAPWYGGWWERMVRCIKDLLKRSLGKACLNYEEMLTILCDCESTINKRPLTYLSDDPNELLPLTPAHFLQDIRSKDEGDTIDLDIIDSQHLRKRIRYMQTMRDSLRKRFQREYLSELVKNPDSATHGRSISEGDIVLVGSDNSKRINWPLARVIKLFRGKDGIERVARLKVASGEIIRPFQRLYPLEMGSKTWTYNKSTDCTPCISKENVDSTKDETAADSVSSTKVDDIPDLHDDAEARVEPEKVFITRLGRRVQRPEKLNL